MTTVMDPPDPGLISRGFYTALISPFEQASRDHLGLNFPSPRKMLRIWASASTRLTGCFDCKACPAVDLYCVVGAGPRDARGDQLGHARLQVASAALVLRGRREPRQAPRA